MLTPSLSNGDTDKSAQNLRLDFHMRQLKKLTGWTKSDVFRKVHWSTSSKCARRTMTKKIVLFSDGTGNSSAKAEKTNVWRLFQALVQADGTQVAYYDDGVGTSSNKYLAAL